MSSFVLYIIIPSFVLNAANSVVINLMKQEKKLEIDEDWVSKDLLKLYEEMATLQSCLLLAAGRLLRIRKIKSKVKEKRSEATYCGLQDVEQ